MAASERAHVLLIDGTRWSCKCRQWEFPYKAMPYRSTRNNRREAELSYMTHRDSQPGAYGAGPGYN
jgi:hypothetical protein